MESDLSLCFVFDKPGPDQVVSSAEGARTVARMVVFIAVTFAYGSESRTFPEAPGQAFAERCTAGQGLLLGHNDPVATGTNQRVVAARLREAGQCPGT